MRKFVLLASEVVGIAALASTLVLAGLLVVPSRAYAAPLPVELGTAGNYSVLGGTGVVNTLNTVLNADLGVSPSNSIMGFSPPGIVDGETHAGDSQAAQAQSDLVLAYRAAAALTPTGTFSGDQIGVTFDAGIYYTPAAFALTGTMTLDGQGNPNAVFIIQVNAALNTAAGTTISLINGAQASNVFWQVNGAVTTGATSSFTGTIMAAGAITVGAGGSIAGRALSFGIVTLADNLITTPDIITFTSPPTPTTSLTSTTTDSVLAAGIPGDSGSITYTSNTSSICSVSLVSGALTYLTSGTCTIQATQAADAAHGDALTTAVTSITVTVPPAYAVTFNGNGSTTGSTATETANVPTALSANGFSRTGYVFSGWNTVAIGGGVFYADGATYPFDAAVTLYAQWTANPAGGGSTTSPPAIAGISPVFGSSAGGTRVTITGTNFVGATVVDFGGAAAINVIVVDSTTITAVTPADTTGLVDVTVTTPGGTSTTSIADTFTYVGAVPIILIQGSPNSATVANGLGYSGQRAVTNGAGTVSYTEAISADSTYVVVTSTGAISSAKSLSPGTYAISGNDSDSNDDTGTWVFVLTVTGTTPAVPAGDYDLVGSDGGVFVFGQPATGFYGSLPGIGVHVNDIVGMATASDDQGYYLVGRDGGVFAFGDATFYGSLPGIGVHVNDIVAISPTANDGGYFLVGKDGGVFAFGDAPFEGSLPGLGTHLNNIVGFATSTSNQGYWIVGSDGHVYAFGDVTNFGSAPGSVTSISSTPRGEGYWLTGPDGGVFAFGDAPFEGSLPGSGIKVNNIISMVPSSDGNGYSLIGADGGVFAFGDATFDGSLPGIGIYVTNIVGAVSTSTGLGQ